MSIVIRDNINIGFINSQMQPCPRNLKDGGEVPFSNLKSINLDGVDDYINCGNGSALQITSNISVSCWFKTTSSGTMMLISKRVLGIGTGLGYQLYMGGGVLRFLVTLSGSVTYTATGTTIINDDQWHHVLGTINQNTQISIILDGSTEASNSIGPEAFVESNSSLLLGYNQVGASHYYFDGLMDEVSIFDALVSSTDLRKDGKPANLSSVSNLIAWYRMGDYSTYQQPQILMPEERNKDKISNYSLDFDGVDDYINVGSDSSLDIFGSDFTISLWAKWGSQTTNSNGIVNFASFTDKAMVGLGFSTAYGKISFGTGTSATIGVLKDCGSGYDDDNWHNIVCIESSGVRSVYVDNVDITSTGSVSSISVGSDNDIGNRARSRYFVGNIDEVAIFDSVVDVATLFNSGTPNDVSSLNPFAYWKLGDESKFTSQWLVPNQMSQDTAFDFETTSNQYIALGTDSSLQPSSAFTISGWIQKEDTNAYAIFGNVTPDGTGNPGFVLWLISNKLRCDIETSAGLKYKSGGTTIAASSEWHHVAATWDVATGTINIYLDGVIDLTPVAGFASDIVYQAGSEGFIGRKGGYEWDGLMSNFAFWDSALTAGNILTLYNNGTPETPISFSPISWWKLDSSATFSTNWSIPDDGSASNTGTSSGMTQANLVRTPISFSNVYSKFSFQFDGVDDYLNMGNPAELQITGALSISCWVKYTQTTDSIVVSKDFFGANRSWALWSNNYQAGNDVTFSLRSSGVGTRVTTTSTINDGNWHHILAVFVPSTSMKIYTDGSLNGENTTSIPATIDISIADVEIGGADSGSYLYEGNADEVAIWNSDQSSNVATIYNSGQPADLTSLSPVAWWRMGEDAYYNPTTSEWNIPDQVGSNDGTSNNLMAIDTLVGEAPNYSGGGVSDNMTIEDREGNAPNSDLNSVSYNMFPDDIETDVP